MCKNATKKLLGKCLVDGGCMWKQFTSNEECTPFNLGTFILRSRSQVLPWAGRCWTEKGMATGQRRWWLLSGGQRWGTVQPHWLGCSCAIRWTYTCALMFTLYNIAIPFFNTLKRFKFFISKDISDQTPESFAAIFFIPNMYFCKPAFPKQCKWIRSDCIDFFFF